MHLRFSNGEDAEECKVLVDVVGRILERKTSAASRKKKDWEYVVEENIEWKEKKGMGRWKSEVQKLRNNCLKLAWILWRWISESEFSKGKPSNRDENDYFSVLYSNNFKYI